MGPRFLLISTGHEYSPWSVFTGCRLQTAVGRSPPGEQYEANDQGQERVTQKTAEYRLQQTKNNQGKARRRREGCATRGSRPLLCTALQRCGQQGLSRSPHPHLMGLGHHQVKDSSSLPRGCCLNTGWCWMNWDERGSSIHTALKRLYST